MRKVLRAVADYDPDYYDMYADEAEAWYAQLYLAWITRHARDLGLPPPARVLEAGCQAGRLAIPLAKMGYAVTGIDTSGFALRRAQEHAKAAGVEATWVRGDVMDVLQPPPQEPYGIVICAEVIYLSRAYRDMLRVLADAVRPGGLLCVSHRPKAYYVLEALRRSQDVETAEAVLAGSEGPFHDSSYYNWQTPQQLRELYGSLGLRWIASHPIDRAGWLGGVNPARLSPEASRRLLDLELAWQADASDIGRYVLVVTGKPSRARAGGADDRA